MEKKMIEMAEDIATVKATTENLNRRINGAFDDIREHIKQGVGWHRTIVSIIVITLLQLGTFIWFLSALNNTVKYNTRAIEQFMLQEIGK